MIQKLVNTLFGFELKSLRPYLSEHPALEACAFALAAGVLVAILFYALIISGLSEPVSFIYDAF